MSSVTAYGVSMLEMGDKSCIGVAIYCGSDGTSDMVNPRLHLRLAQDRCELFCTRAICLPVNGLTWIR